MLFCISLFQPARRRAERRQRPQRHTVASSDLAVAAAAASPIREEESLNRPPPQTQSPKDQPPISRWYSTNKINWKRDSNSDLTPTAPSTPVHFYEEVNEKRPSLLPSAASVVRALSPLLTPAFMAANNMAQKAAKKEVKNEEAEVQPPPQPMEAKDVPILSQVNNFNFSYRVIKQV